MPICGVAASLCEDGSEILVLFDQLLGIRTSSNNMQVLIAGMFDHPFDQVFADSLSTKTRIDLSVLHGYITISRVEILNFGDPVTVLFDVEFALFPGLFFFDIHLFSVA
jgi:hypothetical protein